MNSSANTCSRTCRLGIVIKDYVLPLMQLLTNDIKSYNMGLLTTKCLNTAVMLMYLMMGQRGVEIADMCECNMVRECHQGKRGKKQCTMVDITINNKGTIESLKQSLISQNNMRELYYVLITDGWFEKEGKPTIMFPGHVFVIEKSTGEERPFTLYQSYIDQYDLMGHVKNNAGDMSMNNTQMAGLLEDLEHVMTADVWDSEVIRAWKRITHVNTCEYKGYKCAGKFFICVQRAKICDCMHFLHKYVDSKLTELNAMGEDRLREVYGDRAAYDTGVKALTCAEMKNALQELRKIVSVDNKV